MSNLFSELLLMEDAVSLKLLTQASFLSASTTCWMEGMENSTAIEMGKAKCGKVVKKDESLENI